MFDILLHAQWGGGDFIRAARVLDGFAGTGALGLEALSRGARFASFMENAPQALAMIASNIAACKAEAVTRICRADVLNPPRGTAHNLVFLDPPYGQDMLPAALPALARMGWLAADAVVVAELGVTDEFHPETVLTERQHGKARLIFFKTN